MYDILEDIQVKHPYFNRMIMFTWKRFSATTFGREVRRGLKYKRNDVLKLPLNIQQTSKFKQSDKSTVGLQSRLLAGNVWGILVDHRSLLVLHSYINFHI